jgi:hypothetical protein
VGCIRFFYSRGLSASATDSDTDGFSFREILDLQSVPEDAPIVDTLMYSTFLLSLSLILVYDSMFHSIDNEGHAFAL